MPPDQVARRCPGRHLLSHVFEKAFSARVGKILNLRSGGITRPHQHEYAFALLLGNINERLNPFQAAIGIDRDRIRTSQVFHVHEFGVSQQALGVTFGRRADIAQLGISYYRQTQSLGLLNQRVEGIQSVPQVSFEKGNVHFDSNNVLSRQLEHLSAEFHNSVQAGFAVRLVVQVLMFGDRRRHLGVHRIEPQYQTAILLLADVNHTVGKMFAHQQSFQQIYI